MKRISKVILGIGNIGKEYEGTRHNIGFDVVDLLEKNNTIVEKRQFEHSTVTEILIGETVVACFKPNTYVNLSGIAAAEVLTKYDLTVDDMLVIVDDFHLSLNSIRYRGKGSAGGHNGLKSLIESCGAKFDRLKFGIGPLPEGESVVDFVLGTFADDQIEPYKESVSKACESVQFYVQNDLYDTMNQFNS